MSEASSVEGYEFAGLPLTPTVFARLAVRCFRGQTATRSRIISTVGAMHLELGGADSRSSVQTTSKSALRRLVKQGLAEQAGVVGHYRFADRDDAEPALSLVDDDASLALVTGREWVYVYHLPAYAELASQRGADRWPHKIGMTTGSVESRINDQIGTALPERPQILIAHETDDAALLERVIHGIFELRGQRIDDAVGTEWFDTNADEVRSIIAFVESDTVA